MIKVCHITHGIYHSIGRSTIYEYPRLQAKLGLAVSIIALGKNLSEVTVEQIDGIHLYKIPERLDEHKYNSFTALLAEKFRFAWKAQKILKRLDCDIVHIYSDLNLAAPILPLLTKQSRRKTVYLRDFRTVPVQSGFAPVILMKLLKYQSLFFDATFAQSEGTREMLFGRQRHDIFIARQGANFGLFKPGRNPALRAELGVCPDQLLLVYLGVLSPTRKLDVLFQAMKLVFDQVKERAKWLIVGDGTDREKLMALSQSLGIADRVIFTGFVSYDQVSTYLTGADIGLAYVPLTAAFDRQPPLKTVEMLACGLPVVATNTAGNRHFIRDGVNASLAEDSVEAQAAAILDLIHDEAKRQRYRQIARESVKQYDYETIVRDSIIPQYQTLLDRKRGLH